jgi:hypothetical protein
VKAKERSLASLSTVTSRQVPVHCERRPALQARAKSSCGPGSAEYGWVARALAWDREQDCVARQARLDEIELDAVDLYLPAAPRSRPESVVASM